MYDGSEGDQPVSELASRAWGTELGRADRIGLGLGSIMSNCYDYPKPDTVRRALGEMLGDGVLSAEGESTQLARFIS